jgi:hypothetical protein
MKVGDLVILEYEGVDLKEKERLKIGIVKREIEDWHCEKVFTKHWIVQGSLVQW